jgi:hypothetical protein
MAFHAFRQKILSKAVDDYGRLADELEQISAGGPVFRDALQRH